MLLFIANLGTVGSPIAWTATHRLHHKHADKLEDPTNPKGSVWHKFKNFFSHFKKLPNEKVCVKDLVADRDYLFFHKYYFQIIGFYILLLTIINPLYVGYLYAIPVVYNVICVGWVTTLAHSPELSIFGYRNYNTDDSTYNSLFWQLITMGEGLHNNHHAKPNLWNTAIKKYEFDIASWFIRLLRKNNG
jgi:stearoyl-CoA desaturase (delta-9 desaturase)